MMETYQLGDTVPLKMETRNAAGALYTPDTSIKAAVWDSAGTAVLASSNMTPSATGVYYYNLPTTAAFKRGCYRVIYTTVNDGSTSTGKDFFIMEAGALSNTGWSVMTLADQMRSEMEQNPDAAGGNIPDRVAKIVREKGIWLYNHLDWLFRKIPGSLTVAEGDTTITMPLDFKKLDDRAMRVNENDTYRLLWTEDPSAWQAAKDRIGSTATGSPRIAVLYYTGGVWVAKVWPEVSEAATYDFWYLKTNPWYGTAPIADNINLSPDYWPEEFDDGWYALCAYHLYSRFRSDDSWKGFKSEFNTWLKAHESQNNETLADNLEPVEDVMNDFRHTTSGLSAGSLPGGSGIWYGST